MVAFTQNLNFLLWFQPPTVTPLVSCGRSQAIPLWLLGPAQMSKPGCLERAELFLTGHPPEGAARISALRPSQSSGVNGSLSAPLKGGWAKNICGFFTLSELSQERKDREVLKVFPNAAGKSQSKFRTKSKDDGSVLSDLRRENLSRLKSWCAPFTLVGCRELGLEFPKRN